jgi:hypothetical protein
VGAASVTKVIGIAKNGSILPSSKVVHASDGASTPQSVSGSCVVSLSTNDYIEVFVGNTTSTADPTVLSLNIKVHSI